MLDNATNDETCRTITKRAPHPKQGKSWWPHSCHQEKKWAHLDNWLKQPPHKRKRENKGPSQQRGRGEGKDQNTKNNRANKYIYIYIFLYIVKLGGRNHHHHISPVNLLKKTQQLTNSNQQPGILKQVLQEKSAFYIMPLTLQESHDSRVCPHPPLSLLRPPWAPLPLVCDFALSGVMLTAHETEVLPPSWWSFEIPHSNDASSCNSSSKWQWQVLLFVCLLACTKERKEERTGFYT